MGQEMVAIRGVPWGDVTPVTHAPTLPPGETRQRGAPRTEGPLTSGPIFRDARIPFGRRISVGLRASWQTSAGGCWGGGGQQCAHQVFAPPPPHSPVCNQRSWRVRQNDGQVGGESPVQVAQCPVRSGCPHQVGPSPSPGEAATEHRRGHNHHFHCNSICVNQVHWIGVGMVHSTCGQWPERC